MGASCRVTCHSASIQSEEADGESEDVACEECGNNNIHQLVLQRSGLSDLSLLCTDCCEPLSSVPGDKVVNYSLSNGSFFAKLPMYLKLRDLSCDICQAIDVTLYVPNRDGSTPKSASGVTGSGSGSGSAEAALCVCMNCLGDDAEELISTGKFIGDNNDQFLYQLFGIKEFQSKFKGSARGKGKGRRSKGKGVGGRERRPRREKPVDAQKLKQIEYYHTMMERKKQFDTGNTVKAVGAGKVNSPVVNNKRSTSSPSPRVTPRVTPTSSGRNSPLLKSKSESRSTKASKFSSDSRRSSNFTSDASLSSNNKKVNSSKPKGNSGGSGKPESTKKSNPPTDASKKTAKSNGKPQKPEKPTRSNDSRKSIKETTNTSILNGKHSKPEQIVPKLKAEQPFKPDKAVQQGRKPGRVEILMNKQLKSTKPSSNTPVKTDKAVIVEDTSVDSKKPIPDFKYPDGIRPYVPSKTLKLQYDTMDDYFNEIGHYLFLEQQADSESKYIHPNEMEIEWYQEQDQKHSQYKVNLEMTPEFTERFIPKSQQFKKTPFSNDQSIFLVLNNEVAWSGQVVVSEGGASKGKGGKGKRGSPKRGPSRAPKRNMFEMIVSLHPWNSQPLPLQAHIKHLTLLPASVPISRVFMAMSKVDNPQFIKMLLGHEPIKQIDFKNYLNFTRDSLNASQKIAIQSVLNNSITVLQGPPGTGKTSTIYEIILQLLDNLSTYPILVVAASNIAVDNIAEKLMKDHGRHILRITSAEKETEYNRDHPLASICLHHRTNNDMPEHFKEVARSLRSGGREPVSANQYQKYIQQLIRLNDKHIAQAHVIFTTTVVAGGNQLKAISKLPVVIMDESTQSSEASTLIPLSMPGVRRFVMVGDQKQLSGFSQVSNLSVSLFERVILNGSYKKIHMLDTQYRMHPAISDFPRRVVYNNLLKDGIDASHRKMEGIPSNPVFFWNTGGKCSEGRVRVRYREDAGFSFSNQGEAKRIVTILTKLIYEKNIPRSSIGIVTPYSGQRNLISSILAENELINPDKLDIQEEIDRDDFFESATTINYNNNNNNGKQNRKNGTIQIVNGIMVASIDAFQGREKDFMVMSCVRSNDTNQIGFLADERRLNVALTRAKFGLILVGDYKCLSNGSALWKQYLNDLESKGSVNDAIEFTY
ncbi:uncharacterized protein KQ657_002075 [Scheffersomyces spartinae]|uniref:AAA+ ATPase domain-containing protein n=1 Tax=Scheffersomyces spartinae TaxID=45513 RepID=A0A9P8AKC2_9ASCO|nr:uncharacterized protein KQ657_002075 [Scheffersomyces spartinae]KAG7195693.1 hypothetical protein KQ657_002075 [Scheffersomyces spartinae]